MFTVILKYVMVSCTSYGPFCGNESDKRVAMSGEIVASFKLERIREKSPLNYNQVLISEERKLTAALQVGQSPG